MTTIAQLPEQQTHSASDSLPVPEVTDRPRTSASEAPPKHKWLQNLRRPKSSHSSKPSALRKRQLVPDEEVRRDLALVSSSPTASAHSAVRDENSSAQQQSSSPAQIPDVPTIVVQKEESFPSSTEVKWQHDHSLVDSTRPSSEPAAQNSDDPFRGITTNIPTGEFEEFTSPETMQFTKRGTMLLNGQRVTEMIQRQDEAEADAQPKARPRLNPPPARTGRVLSADDVTLSQKVRSMYEAGGENNLDLTGETLVEEEGEGDQAISQASLAPTQNGSISRTPTVTHRSQSLNVRQPYELAGGIEDWEDIEGGDVDRYGFIIQKKAESRASNRSSSPFDSPGQNRNSQAFLEAPASPKRNYSMRRAPSRARSSRSRPNSRAYKGPASIYSYRSNNSFSHAAGTLRYAANRLPYNRNRRWMDEAADMLTPPPGLAQLAENEDGGRSALAMKQREWEREDKWKNMGKTSKTAAKGGGMLFDFDPKDPKVISRTWKGIPDRWRASAWYSFLTASSKKQKNAPSDEELVKAFHQLQEESSADDMQIDCDVPRTITSHIMFRRRYRGGQRMLFRVLHALSLYFPETGYVQGMAAIVATMLCYYDEEHAFVMTVRLWKLRGLQKLYQDGFGGLMLALADFKERWLQNSEVARRLVRLTVVALEVPINGRQQDELSIPPTSFATKWILTLFNYSLPYEAHLRILDVYLLLGEASNALEPKMRDEFGADLDLLHAASTAILDALRDVLLEGDFENAMRVLTGWISIKDPDLLMKVVYSEYGLKRRRPKS